MAEVLEFVGHLANIFGFVGGVFALLVWLKLRALDRLDEQVQILLRLTPEEGKGKEILLPLEMTRRDVTRAEILGRMGMLPMVEKGKRFSIRYLSTPEFYRGLNAVAANKADTLVIPCSPEEIDQFDL